MTPWRSSARTAAVAVTSSSSRGAAQGLAASRCGGRVITRLALHRQPVPLSLQVGLELLLGIEDGLADSAHPGRDPPV